jgi:D-arabinose 1-dehydrogenase-like Zn-dependent alcohol dehydrogenase
MRAAVLPAPDAGLSIIDRDVPEPGPGEVLVKVCACGMCFSEVPLVRGGYPFARYPVVPGHEVTGTVEAVGWRWLGRRSARSCARSASWWTGSPVATGAGLAPGCSSATR